MMLYTFFAVLLRFIIVSYLTAQLMNSLKSCSYFPVENGETFSFKIWFIKDVRYICSARRSAHLFIIAISSYSHIRRKQSQKIFIYYSCSVTPINIVKNSCERKFLKQTPWSDDLMVLSLKHRIDIL